LDGTLSAKPSTLVLWWNTLLCQRHWEATARGRSSGSGGRLELAGSYEMSESALLELYYCLDHCLERSGETSNAHARWSANVLAATRLQMEIARQGDLQTVSGVHSSPFRYINAVYYAKEECSWQWVEYLVHSWNANFVAILVKLDLQQMLSETSSARRHADDEKLKVFVHLIGILLGLQNRIVSPHEVSEEQVNTLSAWMKEGLDKVQGVLGNIDCKVLNHLDLCRFEELLGFLTVAHSPARQFLRLDFMLAFRNFLSRVKSRCDWDDISQGVIDTCEYLLRELELQVQRDSHVSSPTDFQGYVSIS
ncbi:hypothetical protein OH77DRAFT_357722, partial [Trametes cingulata]